MAKVEFYGRRNSKLKARYSNMNGPEGVYRLSSLRKVAAFLVADSVSNVLTHLVLPTSTRETLF